MPKFPFTNYHELNLDWILKKVNALFDASEENARTIRTYDTRLSSAEQTATSAATAATSAQQLADAAAATAGNALSVAGTADQKADSALTAATDASGAVSGALTIAQEAQQTAGAAVATANDAAATAAGLESLANTANQNATAAVETAGTAVTTANNAAAAAQIADQKAVAAQQTANSAQAASATNAGNITTLQTDVTDLNSQISEKADVIIDSASGSIASFADGGDDMPFKSLVVNIDPVQAGSGYPSPTNVRPISGHTGASVKVKGGNLLDKTGAVRGGFDASGNVLVNSGDSRCVTGFLEVKPNVTYYIDQTIPLTQGRAGFWYDENQTAISQISFNGAGVSSGAVTSPANAKYCRLVYLATNEDVCTMTVGTSALTPYEPYTSGTTTPVSWQSEAGTVYGGTLDVTNGVLTVDMAMVDLGTLTWTKNDSSLIGLPCFYATIPDIKAGSKLIACSAYEIVKDRYFIVKNAQIATGNPSDATYAVVRDDAYANSDTATFKTAMSGVQLCYKLATPITYQLTPQQISTLLGTNNIWTDVGTVDVQYPADTKLYIDGKIAELQALVLEN